MAREPAAADWQAELLLKRPELPSEIALFDALSEGQPQGDRELSIATGGLAPEAVPTEEFAALAAKAFSERGADLLAYMPPHGLASLRRAIAARPQETGAPATEDEILVTGGGQQALSLVSRALLSTGDAAAIEAPTFLGTISSVTATGATVVPIPVDEDGMDVGVLAAAMQRRRIKLVVVQTASQNPVGVDLSLPRRRQLVELAQAHGAFILEDRVYADVRFDRPAPEPLRAQAPDHVILAKSLSKVVGGGFRIGWLASRGPVTRRLRSLKVEADFHSPALTQQMAADFLASGAYDEFLRRTMPFFKVRRDVLVDALGRELGDTFDFVAPMGGHHVWLRARHPGCDEKQFVAEALRCGVRVAPGAEYLGSAAAGCAFRASFCKLGPRDLDLAAKRLGRAAARVFA